MACLAQSAGLTRKWRHFASRRYSLWLSTTCGRGTWTSFACSRCARVSRALLLLGRHSRTTTYCSTTVKHLRGWVGASSQSTVSVAGTAAVQLALRGRMTRHSPHVICHPDLPLKIATAHVYPVPNANRNVTLNTNPITLNDNEEADVMSADRMWSPSRSEL